MTNYASVLGCETTYPVWEERSAHRCRYLSFDLLPYLKAGENVLAVRLGNGWYHQTERIAEGKFVFGLPKLWFELTLTDADGRQEWIESDRQTLWHPGGLLKNNLFLGEVRDLRKEPEGWQDPGADLSGWKPAQPVHAPETLLEEQTCPPDRVIRKLYPILIGEHDGRKFMTVGKISPGALCFPALEKRRMHYGTPCRGTGSRWYAGFRIGGRQRSAAAGSLYLRRKDTDTASVVLLAWLSLF